MMTNSTNDDPRGSTDPELKGGGGVEEATTTTKPIPKSLRSHCVVPKGGYWSIAGDGEDEDEEETGETGPAEAAAEGGGSGGTSVRGRRSSRRRRKSPSMQNPPSIEEENIPKELRTHNRESAYWNEGKHEGKNGENHEKHDEEEATEKEENGGDEVQDERFWSVEEEMRLRYGLRIYGSFKSAKRIAEQLFSNRTHRSVAEKIRREKGKYGDVAYLTDGAILDRYLHDHTPDFVVPTNAHTHGSSSGGSSTTPGTTVTHKRTGGTNSNHWSLEDEMKLRYGIRTYGRGGKGRNTIRNVLLPHKNKVNWESEKQGPEYWTNFSKLDRYIQEHDPDFVRKLLPLGPKFVIAPVTAADTFPRKTMEMICGKGARNVVCWLPKGDGFMVRDPERFVSNILPRYFDLTKYTSFQRQLNLYGFRRVTKGPEVGAYRHDLFHRDHPDRCLQMKRTQQKWTYPKGLRLKKFFCVDNGWFEAEITSYNPKTDLYKVDYIDGDQEELDHDEINTEPFPIPPAYETGMELEGYVKVRTGTTKAATIFFAGEIVSRFFYTPENADTPLLYGTEQTWMYRIASLADDDDYDDLNEHQVQEISERMQQRKRAATQTTVAQEARISLKTEDGRDGKRTRSTTMGGEYQYAKKRKISVDNNDQDDDQDGTSKKVRSIEAKGTDGNSNAGTSNDTHNKTQRRSSKSRVLPSTASTNATAGDAPAEDQTSMSTSDDMSARSAAQQRTPTTVDPAAAASSRPINKANITAADNSTPTTGEMTFTENCVLTIINRILPQHKEGEYDAICPILTDRGCLFDFQHSTDDIKKSGIFFNGWGKFEDGLSHPAKGSNLIRGVGDKIIAVDGILTEDKPLLDTFKLIRRSLLNEHKFVIFRFREKRFL